MISIFGLCAFAGALLLPAYSFATAGDMIARVRAVNIDTLSGSSPVASKALGGKTIPGFEPGGFFTDSISNGLLLIYPLKHDVSLNGAVPPGNGLG